MLCLALLGSLLVPVTSISLQTGSFLRAAEFKQELRVCNAFPGLNHISMSIPGRSNEPLVSSLNYKECRSIPFQFAAGDRLDFKSDEHVSVGTFTIWDMPQHDSILMLVLHRIADVSNSAAFLSHVFSPSKSAQIAVIDAFNGNKDKKLEIMDVKVKDQRQEEMEFDSVMGVAPGSYFLSCKSCEKDPAQNFYAKPGESYTVIRTGWVGKFANTTFPEEMIYYPMSEAPPATKPLTTEPETKREPVPEPLTQAKQALAVEPKPEPVLEPKPEPKAAPAVEQKAEPVPEPKPEPKVAPAVQPKPEPVPEPKAALAAEPKPEPVPEAKPEPKVAPAVVPKPEPVPEAKPEPKAAPVVEQKPEPVPEAKPEPKAAPAVEPKPELVPEAELERKTALAEENNLKPRLPGLKQEPEKSAGASACAPLLLLGAALFCL
eukprot:TRINITY_DN6144_c0_g1_i2.p1 TRINITY_DN6144_c0_g1~~TRINITY_DN6144_c0_g1_i2.p1  ORF type:complete len:432 (-),score=104.83 TRINITY_DN6144_c0_g1_i2:40-1335(-)